MMTRTATAKSRSVFGRSMTWSSSLAPSRTFARVAMNAFIKSAREIAEAGTFGSFADVISNAELNAFFDDAAGPKPT